MTLPQIIVDLLTLLFDMAVPAAICTMVLAGIALRQEGGVNFQTGGKFQRWVLWSQARSSSRLRTLPVYWRRMTIGEAWVRNLIAAMCSFSLSGLLRLGEFWIQHGTAGVR